MNTQMEEPLDPKLLGYELAIEYFDELEVNPERVVQYYSKHGYYRSDYEDGTTVISHDRDEVHRMLSLNKSRSIEIDSVVSVLYGLTDGLLVLATGKRFTQSMTIERQQDGTFLIVASATIYSTAKAIPVEPQNPVAPKIKSALNIKKKVRFADSLTTEAGYQPSGKNTSCGDEMTNQPRVNTDTKPIRSILKREEATDDRLTTEDGASSAETFVSNLASQLPATKP